jgi:hypothetical protein
MHKGSLIKVSADGSVKSVISHTTRQSVHLFTEKVLFLCLNNPKHKQ